jgi:hypothetical protein
MKDEVNPGIWIILGSFFILVGLMATSTLAQLMSLEREFDGSGEIKYVLAGIVALCYSVGIYVIYKPIKEHVMHG